jgi:hypothetical protein
MVTDSIDISGRINLSKFKIVFSSSSFNDINTLLNINYMGIGDPTLISDITTYEYSVSDSAWASMTLETGTDVIDLTFTPSGSAFTFIWKIKEDIGDSIYNKNINIRFQATSSTLETTMAYYSVYFPKIVSDLTNVVSTPPLPVSYQGIDSSDLMSNAPKIIQQ